MVHLDQSGRSRYAGRIPAEHVDPFAHILLAAGNEMALVIALADDIPAAQASAEAAVDEFLTRLLQPPEPRGRTAEARRGHEGNASKA